METSTSLQTVTDLTTRGSGVHPDADALVYQPPKVTRGVPGALWTGKLGGANAVLRLPNPDDWNGKLMIGGIPAVRSEYALDYILSDIVLQQGYAYAACDKATPGVVLLDTRRSMAEWTDVYRELTEFAQQTVAAHYGRAATRTYIAGVSNGGYVVRRMLEEHGDLLDGGVEWEGALWHERYKHLLVTLPICVANYPVYCNWRGDRTQAERHVAYERMVEAGLHPKSEPTWSNYFMVYWVLSLWLYGRSIDSEWAPFQADWSNDWLRDPSPIADYPYQERSGILKERIAPLQNTGGIQKPLLSVAGNWDCLLPFQNHALAYADLVRSAGKEALHRMYEIDRGNHVDGMLRTQLDGQQPVQPYFEACLHHLEQWVEQGATPPASGCYEQVSAFVPNLTLFSATL